MSDVEIKNWEYNLLGEEISLWTIRVGKEFYFFAKEVALSIGYVNPREAVRELIVDDRDKTTIEKVLGQNYKLVLEGIKSTGSKNLPNDFIQKLKTHQKLFTEYGLYSFCIRSRKDRAAPFHNWILKTIRAIRETGFYVLPSGPVENPLDLITKVSNLEKEIKTLRKRETHNKATQTRRSVIVVDGSFKDLEEKIEKSLKKTKSSLKKTIKEAKLDLEKSIKEVRLDLERSTRKITSSNSSSCSSPRIYYSSDSD